MIKFSIITIIALDKINKAKQQRDKIIEQVFDSSKDNESIVQFVGNEFMGIKNPDAIAQVKII